MSAWSHLGDRRGLQRFAPQVKAALGDEPPEAVA